MKPFFCLVGLHRFSKRIISSEKHRLPSIIPFDGAHEIQITMVAIEEKCGCGKIKNYVLMQDELIKK